MFNESPQEVSQWDWNRLKSTNHCKWGFFEIFTVKLDCFVTMINNNPILGDKLQNGMRGAFGKPQGAVHIRP